MYFKFFFLIFSLNYLVDSQCLVMMMYDVCSSQSESNRSIDLSIDRSIVVVIICLANKRQTCSRQNQILIYCLVKTFNKSTNLPDDRKKQQ